MLATATVLLVGADPNKEARYLTWRRQGKLATCPSSAFFPLPKNKFSVFPDETLAQKQSVDGFGVCVLL